MRSARRLLVSLVTVALAGSIGLAPPALAQEGTCPMLTVEEVQAGLGVTGVTAMGSSAYCAFTADGIQLYLAVASGQTLASQRTDYADAVETTVGGHPALTTEQGRAVLVEVPGQVLTLFASGETPWAQLMPALTSLAETAIPRLPAGPSAEDTARLQALLPQTIADLPVTVQSFTGELLLGSMDQTAAPVIAFNEALAAQGKTAADVLFVGVETDDGTDDHSVVAVLIRGADASKLVEPLFRAFASSSEGEATFTPVQVAGRSAIRIEGTGQDPIVVLTSGDVALVANVPEDELESVLARLP